MPHSCAHILPSLRSLRRNSCPITYKIVSLWSAKEHHGDRLTAYMVNVRSVSARQERVENLNTFAKTVHVATGVPPIITPCSLMTDDASRRAAPYRLRRRTRIHDALNAAGRFRRHLKLAQLVVAVACADYRNFADAAIVGDFSG